MISGKNIYCREFLTYLLLGLLSSLFIFSITFFFPNIFRDWELKTYDYRIRFRGGIETYPDIVLIDIDDRSIDAIGRWPWDRSVHARMINTLSLCEARTIAYDILFNQPSDKNGDELLVKATRDVKKLFYPVGFELTSPEISGTKGDNDPHFEDLRPFGFGKFTGDSNGILSVKRTIVPVKDIYQASKGLGHISSARDDDGVIRRVPLIVEMDGEIFPSFALSAVMDYLNVSKDDVVIRTGRDITLRGAQIHGEDRRRDIIIPIDDKGMMLINYAGTWAKTFRHYSFKKIYESTDRKEGFPDFKNSIVVVSNTASGYDLKPVPVDKSYPGGGIHASIINTILTGNFLTEAGMPVKIMVIVLFGVIGASGAFFIRWQIKVVFLLSSISGYILINYYTFKTFGLILDVIPPSMAVIFSSIVASFYQVQAQRSSLTSLTGEKQKIERELEVINKRLAEKEGEIKGILSMISARDRQISDLRLKERLWAGMEEKEGLEREKISILSKLSPFEFEHIRIEAQKFQIISKNRTLMEAFDLVKKVAETDHTVLIMGETGTGKELFAKAIHAMSKRCPGPLVTLNVAAIVNTLAESELFGHVKGAFAGADRNREGLFQKADKGTIFLDEIGDLHPDIQAKLLRVLQDGEIRQVGSSNSIYVDVRVIAATDKDLETEVMAGRFNKALFARLNRYPIILPPLRDRIEDIHYLADELIKRHRGDKKISGISQDSIGYLSGYHWPQNVRQLENVIIRAIVNTNNQEIQLSDVKFAMEQDKRGNVLQNIREVSEERTQNVTEEDDHRLLDELRKTGFSITEAASALKMSRNTITDHFKGICFKYLAEYDGNIRDTAIIISGNHYPADKLENKIKRYYENLISNIQECKDIDSARERCKVIFKNIPKNYYCFIEKLVKRHFENNR